jgi:hypothetical protein
MSYEENQHRKKEIMLFHRKLEISKNGFLRYWLM